MITRSYDVEHTEERKEFTERLEEAYRDTDWRSIGGFNTADTKYAAEVRELLLTTMQFLTDFEDHFVACSDHHIAEINEADYRNDQLETKLNKIADWVADQKRLEHVTNIINEGGE
jgi:hypothetical protein|tara:strand:- start:75 stop:422 length:348 start_codon:yes stop_codon:yes gene_type:complete